MSKKFLVYLAVFAFISLAFATTPTGQLVQWVEGTFASVGLGDWRGISVFVAMISVMMAALAYMFAEPFNFPQLKAWANEELAQAVVTVIILIAVVGVLDFADAVIYQQTNYAPGSPFTCDNTIGVTCTVQVSNQYLEGLVNMSLEGAKESFTKAIEVMKQQSKGQTMSCGTLLIPPCFMYYNSLKNNAYMLLDYERYTQEVELYNSIMYSLQIQRFFATYAANIVGPFLLILGIIGRNFFATRKLGGLLMAIGLALLIVFPGMYLWNAISLNVALYGDDILKDKAECPDACKKGAPIAYTPSGGPVYFAKELSFGNEISEEAHSKLQMLVNGSAQQVDGYYSCEYAGLHTGITVGGKNITCPKECRELPYPYYVGVCQDNETELACNHVPKGCKLIRNQSVSYGFQSGSNPDNNGVYWCNTDTKYYPDGNLTEDYCPDYCKIIPPLTGTSWASDSSTCDVCVNAPWNCRVAIRNDSANMPNGTHWRPETCIPIEGLDSADASCIDTDRDGTCDNAGLSAEQQAIKNATLACNATMNENTTCAWVVPDPPDVACEGPSCCIGSCREIAQITIKTPAAGSTYLNTSSLAVFACTMPTNPSYNNYDSCAPGVSGCMDYCILGACMSPNPADPASGCEEAGDDVTGLTCKEIIDTMSTTNDASLVTALQKLYPYCTADPSSRLYYNLSAACWKFPACSDKDGDNECDSQKACTGYGPDKAEPSARCNSCFGVSTGACLYSPPVVTECNEECDETGEDSPLKVSPAEFAKKSQNWMFGRQDIKNVASLLVPAYLLPLLNVAVTLIFIRTFSPIFGGDIEIPGWARVL